MIKLHLDILKFLGPGQCARQVTDAERKLQSSCYGDDSFVASLPHSKEQEIDMESHAHHG